MRHYSLLQRGGGGGAAACAVGTFFSFGDAENVKKKCHKQLFLQEWEEVGGLLMRYFVLFSISVVFFVSTQPHTLKLSGGSRDGGISGARLWNHHAYL